LKYSRIFLFFCICIIPVIAQQKTTEFQKKEYSDFFVTIGYWNDNFYFDREVNQLFDKNIFQTDDDFLTTSLWLRLSFARNNSRWFVDTYFNIITAKEENFRTDLFSIRVMKEVNTGKELLRYGGGIVTNGDLGGEKFQNSYHKLFSIKKVILPYTREKYFGLAGYFSYRRAIYENELIRVSGSGSMSYLTGGGPAFIETGIVGLVPVIKERLTFRVHVGYEYYYQVKPMFKKFFEKGFLWGAITTLRVYEGIQTSLWITSNQYGTGSQNHFGISFTFAGDRLVPVNFDDVKFP